MIQRIFHFQKDVSISQLEVRMVLQTAQIVKKSSAICVRRLTDKNVHEMLRHFVAIMILLLGILLRGNCLTCYSCSDVSSEKLPSCQEPFMSGNDTQHSTVNCPNHSKFRYCGKFTQRLPGSSRILLTRGCSAAPRTGVEDCLLPATAGFLRSDIMKRPALCVCTTNLCNEGAMGAERGFFLVVLKLGTALTVLCGRMTSVGYFVCVMIIISFSYDQGYVFSWF